MTCPVSLGVTPDMSDVPARQSLLDTTKDYGDLFTTKGENFESLDTYFCFPLAQVLT